MLLKLICAHIICMGIGKVQQELLLQALHRCISSS